MADEKYTPPLMREGLAHQWNYSGDDALFFERIDSTGGWPVGFQFVGFEHTDERNAGFTNSPNNNGWWTVIASADDYYLWKLSPKALQRIVDAALANARVTQVDASKVWFRNSRGSRSALTKATKEQS